MGELGDGEDALPGVALDLLLAHAPQQADVVLLHRLVVAPLAELADLAVVVQDQPRRRLGTDHLLHFPKEAFGLPQVSVQTYLGRLAFLAVPDDPARRHLPLQPGEEQAVQFQQEPLLLADLPPLVEQHRDVVEVPQLRRPIDLLQPVEAERQQVVFQGGVQHERRTCPQGSGGQGDVPRHLGLRDAWRGSCRWPAA